MACSEDRKQTARPPSRRHPSHGRPEVAHDPPMARGPCRVHGRRRPLEMHAPARCSLRGHAAPSAHSQPAIPVGSVPVVPWGRSLRSPPAARKGAHPPCLLGILPRQKRGATSARLPLRRRGVRAGLVHIQGPHPLARLNTTTPATLHVLLRSARRRRLRTRAGPLAVSRNAMQHHCPWTRLGQRAVNGLEALRDTVANTTGPGQRRR